jgi:hypothetical protein
VTRTLRTDAVAVELGRGWWRARWADGPVAGPYTVTAGDPEGDPAGDPDDARRRADAAPGAWRIEIGACDDRPGSWAHWRPTADGPGFAVHVPAEGPVLVVEAGPRSAGHEHAVTVLVDSAAEPTGEPGEPDEPGEGPGETTVAVARGSRAGTAWAVLAAGPGANRLVSEARR